MAETKTVNKNTVSGWGVEEVATQTELVMTNPDTGESFNTYEMLCSIKNDLEQIKKNVVTG
jgi:hypothetical protein